MLTYAWALWRNQSLPSPTSRKHKTAKKPSPKTLLTESQVLYARARREFFGTPIHVLARQMGTSEQYMRNLLDYQVRGHLIPKREDANLQPEAS